MNAETPSPRIPSARTHRWIARIGASLWIVVLLFMMFDRQRFEPLLLAALVVPYIALFVVFERMVDSARGKPYAIAVLLLGVGMLLMWVDGLIRLRPDWAELVSPSIGSAPPLRQFATTGRVLALAGLVVGIGLALARRARPAATS